MRQGMNFQRLCSEMQLPHCLGAVDDKHVVIVQPPRAGSYFFNCKGYDSQVLIGIADSEYEFIYLSFGTNGCVWGV